jgi:hypothetical protein
VRNTPTQRHRVVERVSGSKGEDVRGRPACVAYCRGWCRRQGLCMQAYWQCQAAMAVHAVHNDLQAANTAPSVCVCPHPLFSNEPQRTLPAPAWHQVHEFTHLLHTTFRALLHGLVPPWSSFEGSRSTIAGESVLCLWRWRRA